MSGIYGLTQTETTTYVANYIKDRYGKEMTPEELYRKLPYHQIVWQKFLAYAYYKKKDYYESWDEVPEPVEGLCAYVVKKDIMERRMFRNGAWRDLGSDHPECYK